MEQKGKRVVIVISGLRGVFYASLEVARRLSKKGATVIFASSSDLSERLKHYPYAFHLLPDMHIPANFGGDFHVQFQEAIKEADGDVYFVDLECPVYILTCLSLGAKVKILNHFLPIPTFPDLPIPNQHIIPGEGIRGLGYSIRLNWLKSRSKQFMKAILERYKNQSADRRSLLIGLGEAMGLRKKDFLYSRTLLPGPYLYFSKVPMLHLTASELDFEHKMRSTERYVGPMVFRARKESISNEVKANVQKLLDEAQDKNLKIIYCSLSSLKATSPQFLNKLMEVFRHEIGWIVLISLGNKSAEPEKDVPQNMHFFPWLPVQEILPKADLVLNSAGFHSVHECIYYEVPMLSFSLGITDQNGFLARIKSKGLGLTTTAKESIPKINSKIHLLLNELHFRKSLEEMKREFSRYEKEEILEKSLLD